MRLPANLREAAVLAAELGLAASTTELTVRGLRDALEAFDQRAVLDAQYRNHPDARSDLAEIAIAAAAIDGHPLAAHPELVRRAAAEVGLVKTTLAPMTYCSTPLAWPPQLHEAGAHSCPGQ